MEHTNPAIPIKNRYSVFADCLINKQDNNKRNTTSMDNTYSNANLQAIPPIMTPKKIQPSTPLPLQSIHGNVNHIKLIYALKDKYNTFQAKYTFAKLKIMLININDFSESRTICLKENIEYYTYTINTEKILTVVLKELIHLPELRISNNLKSEGLNPIHCVQIQIRGKSENILRKIRLP